MESGVQGRRSKLSIHHEICEEIKKVYSAKNQDYGDSFGKGYAKRGMLSVIIRLEDKMSRLEQLTVRTTSAPSVTNESIEDTLMDLANYAIMTIVELRNNKQDEPCAVQLDMTQPLYYPPGVR